MPTVVVIGGGFAGCSAALAVAKAGAEAILLEKTDMLCGVGVLSGVVQGEGGHAAVHEARALGGGEIFDVFDSIQLYHIDYLEQLNRKHVSIFDVLKVDRAVRAALEVAGVKVKLQARAKDVRMKGNALAHVLLDDGTKVEGDSFVDATGNSGTVAECTKHGFGCVMCMMRCPTFGGRVSITAKAGVRDIACMRPDGKLGAFTSGFTLIKESLGAEVRDELEKMGYMILPLPKELIHYDKLEKITATDNAQPAFIENLVIINNGFAKIMVQCYMPLDELHQLSGFENARMIDPLCGGVGNAVRGLAMAPRANSLKVEGLANLYCAGEKSGPQCGIVPATITGTLAGHNAARHCFGKEDLVLPRSLAIGDHVAFQKEMMDSGAQLYHRYGFTGAFFDRMKSRRLIYLHPEEIRERVEREGLRDVFAKRLG